jgi:hypothetical protein
MQIVAVARGGPPSMIDHYPIIQELLHYDVDDGRVLFAGTLFP